MPLLFEGNSKARVLLHEVQGNGPSQNAPWGNNFTLVQIQGASALSRLHAVRHPTQQYFLLFERRNVMGNYHLTWGKTHSIHLLKTICPEGQSEK